MWTGIKGRSYNSLTVWAPSEHRNSHEHFLELIEMPKLIFTEGPEIYNEKDHHNIHQGVLIIPWTDELLPAFQHLCKTKMQTLTKLMAENYNHLSFCTESA